MNGKQKNAKGYKSSSPIPGIQLSEKKSLVSVLIATIFTNSLQIIRPSDPKVVATRRAILIGFVTLLVAGAILSVTVGAMI